MKTLTSLLLIALCAVGTSCVGSRKMSGARERLNTIKETQALEASQVKQISSTTQKKLKDNKIDSIINSRFDFRVGRIHIEIDSVSGEIAFLDSLMANKKDFRKTYKNIIIPKLATLDSFRNESLKRKQVYLMLEDGINTANYTLFDLAAFFGPGKYAIPEGQEEIATNSFAPLVDSVIKFSEKYKNFNQTATLVILGFADGTGFDPQSALYAELAGLIGKVPVSKQELNKKLSELRALTLIKQLQKQFLSKTGTGKTAAPVNVEYLAIGKGEELPFSSISNYKDEDERRRIVLCYWAILPK
ncbi:MAG: hypothetical protein ABL876_02380 [Chitinophagaceae bacterium]